MDKPSFAAYRTNGGFHDDFQSPAFFIDLASQFILSLTGIVTYILVLRRPWAYTSELVGPGWWRTKCFKGGTILLVLTVTLDIIGVMMKRQAPHVRYTYNIMGALTCATYMAADFLLSFVMVLQITYREQSQADAMLPSFIMLCLVPVTIMRWGFACYSFSKQESQGPPNHYIAGLEVGYKTFFMFAALQLMRVAGIYLRLTVEGDLFPKSTSLLGYLFLAFKVFAMAISIKILETLDLGKSSQDVSASFSYAADATTNFFWVIILILLASMSLTTNQILKERASQNTDNESSTNADDPETGLPKPDHSAPPYAYLPKTLTMFDDKSTVESYLLQDWPKEPAQSIEEVEAESGFGSVSGSGSRSGSGSVHQSSFDVVKSRPGTCCLKEDFKGW